MFYHISPYGQHSFKYQIVSISMYICQKVYIEWLQHIQEATNEMCIPSNCLDIYAVCL